MLGASKTYALKAVEREPGNVLMLLLLARLHESAVQADDAEGSYRAAVAAQPGHSQARLELAQFLLRRKKIDDAAEQFEQLRECRAERPAVLMGLVLCRRQQGRTEEERELLDTVVSELPDNAEALAERGRLELEADELEAAERDLRKAVLKLPHDSQVLFHLGQCLDRRGKENEAALYRAELAQVQADLKSLEMLIGEIVKSPNDAEKRRQAGLICQRIGRDQQAERWFLGALQADRSHKPTYQSLADFYTHIGRLELAAQYREAAR